MKKLIIWLLCVILLCSLSACKAEQPTIRDDIYKVRVILMNEPAGMVTKAMSRIEKHEAKALYKGSGHLQKNSH